MTNKSTLSNYKRGVAFLAKHCDISDTENVPIVQTGREEKG